MCRFSPAGPAQIRAAVPEALLPHGVVYIGILWFFYPHERKLSIPTVNFDEIHLNFYSGMKWQVLLRTLSVGLLNILVDAKRSVAADNLSK